MEFDRVWRDGWMTRSDAYAWMAHAMDLQQRDMHIGQFLQARCRMVVDTVEQFFTAARATVGTGEVRDVG
jgi:hypothetical protein